MVLFVMAGFAFAVKQSLLLGLKANPMGQNIGFVAIFVGFGWLSTNAWVKNDDHSKFMTR